VARTGYITSAKGNVKSRIVARNSLSGLRLVLSLWFGRIVKIGLTDTFPLDNTLNLSTSVIEG
jgi:hypothetical protein